MLFEFLFNSVEEEKKSYNHHKHSELGVVNWVRGNQYSIHDTTMSATNKKKSGKNPASMFFGELCCNGYICFIAPRAKDAAAVAKKRSMSKKQFLDALVVAAALQNPVPTCQICSTNRPDRWRNVASCGDCYKHRIRMKKDLPEDLKKYDVRCTCGEKLACVFVLPTCGNCLKDNTNEREITSDDMKKHGLGGKCECSKNCLSIVKCPAFRKKTKHLLNLFKNNPDCGNDIEFPTVQEMLNEEDDYDDELPDIAADISQLDSARTPDDRSIHQDTEFITGEQMREVFAKITS